MSNPLYHKAAVELAERFGCTTVAIVCVGQSGLIHTGAFGPHGALIAAAAMDKALDALHPPRKCLAIGGEEGA